MQSDKENIEDVISYLNGLDYDKYCKDMEIREALTLLKHKMDKEKEEKINAEENAQNKVTIEGVEKQGTSYPWSASLNSQNILDGHILNTD